MGPPPLSPLRGFDERCRGAVPGLPPWAKIYRPSGAITRGVALPTAAVLALVDRISERHWGEGSQGWPPLHYATLRYACPSGSIQSGQSHTASVMVVRATVHLTGRTLRSP